MKKSYLILILSVIFGGFLNAQETTNSNEKWVTATIYEADTIPMVHLNLLDIKGDRIFRSAKEKKNYDRLKYNVTKVYPYAKLASQLLAQYEDSIALAETEREKSKFYKQVEIDLRAEYEEELMNLTVTQGRILIKLIDRETGNNSYELVKDLRNVVTAFFWQGLAKIFGHDLKSEYDPLGEDQEIESIVLALENGWT